MLKNSHSYFMFLDAPRIVDYSYMYMLMFPQVSVTYSYILSCLLRVKHADLGDTDLPGMQGDDAEAHLRPQRYRTRD